MDQVNPSEKFDFNSSEDILIEVISDSLSVHKGSSWNGFGIESCTAINLANPSVIGAAQYERSYGNGMDYAVWDLIECPGVGWWVVMKVTGDYIRGDGMTSDDDMILRCEGVRPATEDDIAQA